MSPKQLGSILDRYPAATTAGQKQTQEKKIEAPNLPIITNAEVAADVEELGRLAIRVPMILKDEIKNYVKKHKGETEKTVLLKALKAFGFKIIEDSWLVDQRSTR